MRLFNRIFHPGPYARPFSGFGSSSQPPFPPRDSSWTLEELLDNLAFHEIAVVNLDFNNSGQRYLALCCGVNTTHKAVFFRDESGIHYVGHLTSNPYGDSVDLGPCPDNPLQGNHWVPSSGPRFLPKPSSLSEIVSQISKPDWGHHPRFGGSLDQGLSDYMNSSESVKSKVLETLAQRQSLSEEKSP